MRRRGLLLVPAAAATLAAGCTVTVPPVTGEARGRVLLLRGRPTSSRPGWTGWRSASQTRAMARRCTTTPTGPPSPDGRVVAEARAGALPRSFAVVGHSLGADDAIRLVGAAGAEGVATDLLVTFDPVFLGTCLPGRAWC